MQALTLCRFDPVLGTVIFLKTPDSLFQEELDKIPSLMAIPSEGFFIHTFETFTTANLFIKLPSSNARGGIEKFLISIIIEGDSAVDLSVGKQFLVNFANDFINLEDAYKGLDIESKGYKGDIEKLNQIKNLFNSFFKTVKPVIDTLEISEHNLKERVKELTCLYGLSEFLDDPYNSVEDVLLKTLNLIPPAWQYPENTCARIICNNKEYKTGNFSDTPWAQTIVKEILGNILTIQVNYLEDKPFLKEEENLLIDIGNRLKTYMEEKDADQNVKERVKELTCLYGLSEFLDDPNNSVEDILYETLSLIPPAWQYPENTCARIIYNNKEHKTGNFSDTPWAQTIVKEISGNILTIQVNYLEDKPFLREEDNLLNDIGNRLKMRFEQKKTEQKVKDSEEKYRIITSSAKDAIIQINNEGSILYWNEAAEFIFGHKKEEIFKKAIHDLILPKRYHDAYKKEFAHFRTTGEGAVIGKTLELTAKTKGNKEIFVSISISAVKIKDNWNSIAIIRDITEQKEAQQKLKESEEKWRSLTEYSSDNIMSVDLNYNILFINHTNPGITREEMIGKSLFLYIPKKFHEKVKECFQGVLNTSKPDLYFTDYTGIDGIENFYEARVGPVMADGKIIGFTISGSEITERKKAEEDLRNSEETYRTLSKNIPGMVYRAKPDWSTEIITDSEIISGYTIEEFNSNEINWLKIIHPDDKNKVLNDSAKLTNNAMKLIQEYRIIAKDGSIHWVEDHKTSFFNKDGSLKGIDGVVYDITSRKKAEQNIKENLETTNLILEKLPVGVILIGKDKKIQSINEKALKIINYNEEDIIGKECFDLFCPSQKGNCPILDFGKSIDNSDEIILARNGDRIPILKTVIPITLQGEELLLEAFSDITSLKDVEESLKGALSDLDQIFDHTIPMYITDLDYNIIRVNKSFMNLFQVDSKHSLGKKCFDIWGGSLCNTPECSLKQILAGKEDYAYTMQKKLLNGEKISCIVRNFPYRNQENKILGVIKNFTNITDVIETERRMRVGKIKKNKDE